MNAGADIALRYNDTSVLENFHCATGFRLMKKDPQADVLGSMIGPRDAALVARRTIIHLVLATDLTSHQEHLGQFKQVASKGAGSSSGNRLGRIGQSDTDRLTLMAMTIKCADISHPAKDISTHRRWTSRCQREFSAQQALEEEMALPVSMKVEQTTAGVAKSQIGFIRFLVKVCSTAIMPPVCPACPVPLLALHLLHLPS